jgi:flagellar hook-basal body complex protein FliE
VIEAVAAMTAALSDLASLAGAASATSAAPVPDATAGDASASISFGQALKSALDGVDHSIADANTAARGFSAGDKSIPLSDVMVSMEQANLALQMASGVRDKVVSAYTNIMNMQI